MADKIKKSYKFSKKFYDDALTQSKWWSRLYFRLLWCCCDGRLDSSNAVYYESPVAPFSRLSDRLQGSM
ncbi:MAG: hypothetical protein IKW84_01780 [Bacteroidaceae bacterium]|nr:hypothetical protein [Bacteroidaceae bacterium]